MWELGPDADKPEWHTVESPFEKTLFGVVHTAAGPYAIGDGGTLIANRGNGWKVILDDGPRTRQNQLRGMDVTDDGERIWFAGSSGSLGCYDVTARKKYDYSNPNEKTSTWEGLTVSGPAGSEKVLAANGSGEILPFSLDGLDENWDPVRKPASQGASVAALAASPAGIGYAVDTSGNAFRTTATEGWEDIGIVNAQVKFYDIWAGSDERVFVAAGDGRIYRYDDSYNSWTPIGVGEDSLRAIDRYDDQTVVIGDGGTIHERSGDDRWEQLHSPVEDKLTDVSLGDPDVIVGNEGTILERERPESDEGGESESDGDDGGTSGGEGSGDTGSGGNGESGSDE